MPVFQHALWGYEITYPDTWTHQTIQDIEVFAPSAEALEPDPDYGAGQLHIRAEWNWARQEVEPLWNQHIGKLAGMLGAKNVGSAPWRLGAATGVEAEIVLPKKDNRRLWTGILAQDFRVLHFMVTHPREVRAEFEPLATKLIASLRFAEHTAESTTAEGLPLPPGYEPVAPCTILADIGDPAPWRAFSGPNGVGALQAFYLRELPFYDWQIDEYVPFPGASDLGFARLKLYRPTLQITLGLMPASQPKEDAAPDQAHIIYKITPAG